MHKCIPRFLFINRCLKGSSNGDFGDIQFQKFRDLFVRWDGAIRNLHSRDFIEIKERKRKDSTQNFEKFFLSN